MSENDLPTNSEDWTTEEHRRMACSLLDGLHIANLHERATSSEPARRHYTADVTDGANEAEPVYDLGPFLAALAHAALAAPAPTHDRAVEREEETHG